MIKATELRIGNLIYWAIPEKESVPHKVTAILPNTFHTIPISFGEHDEYKPIELTEQWLIRFGFSKTAIGHGWYAIEYEVEYGDDDVANMLCGHIVEIGVNVESKWGYVENVSEKEAATCSTKHKIQYVHQLQNLYFALTGQELELK